jgi:hypothetical protein
MREIYTFYYKSEQNGAIAYGITKCHAVSFEDANSKFYSWALNKNIDILDFDHETEAIEEEREY